MAIGPTRGWIALLTLPALTACECIDVPAQDSTRPHAALTVIYRDDGPGMPERTVTVTSAELGDPPVLRIPLTRAFQVLYSGNDDGGVRTLTAEYDPDPGSSSGALFAVPAIPDGDFSSCAKTTRVLSFDWEMLGHATLRVTAEDFHGNVASTRTLHIAPVE
jgi:hypothetical protein